MTKKKATLKPSDLGLVDDVVLSAQFNNTREVFKTVQRRVVGYYVAGDGYRSPVRIAPIYDATIYVRRGKLNHIFVSHEIGEYFNPSREIHLEPDRDGDALAFIASSAIGALVNHSRLEAMRYMIQPSPQKTSKKTRPKTSSKARSK